MDAPSSIRAIVPLTVNTAFTPNEVALLRTVGLDEMKMFEYILATWGVFVDFFRMGRRDYAYDQLMADLADDLFIDQQNPHTTQAQQLFSQRADALFDILQRLHLTLHPMIGSLSDGVPDKPVEMITYHDWTRQASVLELHLQDPTSLSQEEIFAQNRMTRSQLENARQLYSQPPFFARQTA